MCEDLHLHTPLLTLPSGLEVSWLPPIIHSFAEGQSSRIHLSFQPCAISCWLSIGGGEPKGTEASLGDSLYLLSRLFPELSTSLFYLSHSPIHPFIHPCIHSFTHSGITFVKHLLANSTSSRGQGHVYTLQTWQATCLKDAPTTQSQLVIALWNCRPRVPCLPIC